MEKLKVNYIRPFGPSTLKAQIPEEIIKSLNSYVDNSINDQEKVNKIDHGKKLVGDVSQELRLEDEIVDKIGFKDFLQKCVSIWIETELKKKITKFDIIDTWVVRQFQNEYNPTHWHGGHISGVGYLKVPKDLGQFTQKEKDKYYIGGRLQLIHGSKMFMSPSTVNLTPKVGDFYFFPNYLMHTVFPFKNSNEERRSVSFNAKIDDNIYNVYGG